jgi:queuosine precursor transporter
VRPALPPSPAPAPAPSILRDKRAVLFFVLGAFLLSNAVVAEIIGVKLFQLEHVLGLEKADFGLFGTDHLSFRLSIGVLSWPLVFLVTDVVNDYFGVRGVRLITLVTVALIALMFPILHLAIEAPPDRSWWIASGIDGAVPDMQAAFAAIMGQGMNIIVGSLVAFLVAQLIDAMVFRRLKRATGERRMWLRATGSTLVSQLVDSLLVTWVAFAVFRGMPLAEATALALTAYAYKFCVAVLATPLLYVAHAGIERWLGPSLAAAMRAAALANR